MIHYWSEIMRAEIWICRRDNLKLRSLRKDKERDHVQEHLNGNNMALVLSSCTGMKRNTYCKYIVN